ATRVLVQPNGRLLLTGPFNTLSNAVPAAGVTRLNADGSLDQTFFDIKGAAAVNTAALLPDGRVAIAGLFSTANTVARVNLAVLQGDLIDPAFTVPPVGQTLLAGANLNLTATATGSGGLSYQWYRNGILLVGQTGPTLTVNGVTLADAGLYTLVAMSPAGTNQTTAQVTILGSPVITQQPFAGEFWVGSTNSLSVAASGQPTLAYQWSKNSSPLAGATNAVLTLTNAQTTDAGTYAVAITNALGATNSVSVVVTITNRPGLLITNWASALPAAGSATFNDVRALPDGRFLVCGNDLFGNTPYLFRLNSDGTADGTFSAGLTGLGNLGKMALTPDAQIYLQRAATLERHGSNGAIDAAFVFRGISGTAVPAINSFVVAPDGRIIVGGSFLYYGTLPARHLIRLFPDGSLDGGFTSANPTNVTAVAVQPDGKVLAALTLGGGVSQIVRYLPDGTQDATFDAGTVTPSGGGNVNKLAVQPDGRILVGGGIFNAFAGSPAGGLVRLLANGSRDYTFNAPLDASANDLTVQANGRVVVASGGTTKGFRRYEPDGTLEAKFMLDDGAVSTGAALSVAVDPTGRILAAGTFNAWNVDSTHSYTRRSLALLNGDPVDLFIYQQPAPQFVTNNSPATFSVGVAAAAGYTLQWLKNGTNLAGQTGGSLAIANVTPADQGYYSVLVSSGSLVRTSAVAALTVVGGPVITVPPVDTSAYYQGIATLNVGATGLAPLSFRWRFGGAFISAGTNSVLYFTNLTFAATGTYDVVISNALNTITSAPVQLTVVLRQGSRDASFVVGTGPNVAVQQLFTLPDGRSYLAGSFTTYSGINRNTLALVNADGTLNTTFSNTIAANSSVLTGGVQSDGRLVLGGAFTGWSTFATPYLARLQLNGLVDTNFTRNLGAGPNLQVNRLAIAPDDKIVIAGSFLTVDGHARTNLARLNADGSLDYTFRATNTIYTSGPLTVQPDGKVIFSTASSGLVRLKLDGTPDATFTAPTFNSTLNTVVLQPDGKLLVGGFFTSAGLPNRYLTRLNADGTSDTSFNPGTNIAASVSGIQVAADGRILITGTFTTVNNQSRNYVARLNADGSLDNTFLPGTGLAGGTPSDAKVSIQYNGRILLAGGFTTYDGISTPYFTGVYGQTNTFAITNQPVAQTVAAGSAVSFTVGVYGNGPLGYQWFKNGLALAGQNQAALNFTNAQLFDTGFYSVL
ncbi:MAG TPA: immunoglobulin domain-containing protein, partial [Verrucomicrobiae bacterium]